jgi:uncharacterized protein (DUF362 family)
MMAVATTQNVLIEQAIPEALHHLEMEALIRGKRMAVKPNDPWASAEDATVVTQPDTLRTVLRYVRQLGPVSWLSPGGGCGRDRGGFRPRGAHGCGNAGRRHVLRP